MSNLALAHSIGLPIAFSDITLDPMPLDEDKLSYWTLLGWLERREEELPDPEEEEGSSTGGESYKSVVFPHSLGTMQYPEAEKTEKE